MSSAEEQVILRCSTVERELDITYCRSFRNHEPCGEIASCIKSVKLKRSKKD